jgi:hypothetical protein
MAQLPQALEDADNELSPIARQALAELLQEICSCGTLDTHRTASA